MTWRRMATVAFGVALGVAALSIAVTVMAQGHAGHAPAQRPAGQSAAPNDTSKPRPISMDELHRFGGVPRGWKFTLPPGGDPARGRQLFAELECYKCHTVQGAGFPPLGSDGKTGPELTRMGAHHPAEYFAESILAPNNVLLSGPGWIGPDGRSTMPSFADSLTVTQLLDLVAFIKSQDGKQVTADDVKVQTRLTAAGPRSRRRPVSRAPPVESGRGESGRARARRPRRAGHHGGEARPGPPGT